MEERLAKQRKIDDAKYTMKYICCDFILGSSAEAERLFSFTNFVLAEHRQRMIPELFEAIVFLKANADYWGAEAVSITLTNISRHQED